MPSENEILQTVRQAAHLVNGAPLESIQPASRLVADLKMESIDTVDLLFEIQKQLDLSINLSEVFQSLREESGQRDQFDIRIQDLVKYIQEMLAR